MTRFNLFQVRLLRNGKHGLLVLMLFSYLSIIIYLPIY